MRHLSLLVVTLVSICTGCVSYPSKDLVQPWPADPPAGYAMVLVYSTQKGGRGPTVFVDDTELFRIPGISYSWAYVPAGEHAFKTKYWMMFHGLDMNKRVNFHAGEKYYFKTEMWQGKSPAPGFVMAIQAATFRVSAEKGEAEAKKCWYRKPKISRLPSNTVSGKPNA
jgi:hypothetical protein